MARSSPWTVVSLLILALLLLPFPSFGADTYTITASAGTGGRISPSGELTVSRGSDQAFVIEAFGGYRIENVQVDQRSLGAIPLYTFNKVNTNHVITATFLPLFGSLQVDSKPAGAEVFIDNTFYGITDPGGPVTFSRIIPGPHTVRMLLTGYLEYQAEVQVKEGQTTVLPAAILLPVPTTATTAPTTTITTVPTTTQPTTSVTTTATTTQPTTSVTTTATTTQPTTSVTTTATTTQPTTSVTTTATTTQPTTSVTTTATTTQPTTSVTTTATTTQPTTSVTTAATETHPTVTITTEETPRPPVTTPLAPGNGGIPPSSPPIPEIFIILAAGGLSTIILSRDVLSSTRMRDIPLTRRLLACALFAIPCTAMGVVLHWYLQFPGGSAGGLFPELVAVVLPLVVYLILSSVALMMGSLLSWPFRGMLKAHTVAGVLIIFLALMALISGDPSRRFITGVTLFAGVLSTLAARWQDDAYSHDRGGSGGAEEDNIMPRNGPDKTSVLPLTGKGMFPPELADKYTVEEFIGSGGLARVFKARNHQTGQEVALKIPLHSDENTGKSFLKEIVGWEGLEHENIVRVTGVNILPIPYVEMEFIEKTLSDLPRPLPVQSAARICRDVARGLMFAHDRGIIHRDIKPQNILVTSEGVPKITDWGMSKVMGVTGMPTITGFSLAYAAPEQLAPLTFGETDQRTDIYQMGCVLYELITGTVPFPGNDMVQVSSLITSEVPKLPSSMNPHAKPLDPIVMRCLEKRPEDRYPNVRDLIRDLERFLLVDERGDRYNIFED